jgi:nucleoside-triphosphatase THEP1
MRLAKAINEGADLVIINRFGKLEAEDMGFVEEIRQAADANIAVLIAVAEERFMMWNRFSMGMGVKLHCSREPLEA